jgi:hypothetical protein
MGPGDPDLRSMGDHRPCLGDALRWPALHLQANSVLSLLDQTERPRKSATSQRERERIVAEVKSFNFVSASREHRLRSPQRGCPEMNLRLLAGSMNFFMFFAVSLQSLYLSFMCLSTLSTEVNSQPIQGIS